MYIFDTMGLRCSKPGALWEVYKWICRLWGIATAICLWGTGVETTYRQQVLGPYLLAAAVVVTFFESVFVVLFWLELCIRDEGACCVRVWRGLAWLDHWRKGVLYVCVAAGCLVKPRDCWLAAVPGVMLLAAGGLYCIQTLKWRREQQEEEARAKLQTYDRFDEVQEDMEDHVIGSSTEPPVYNPETLADQDEILDV